VLKVRNYILLAFLAGAVVLLDQLTKYLVRTRLALNEIWMPIAAIRPYLHVVYRTNTGAAFSMFQQGGIVFTILAVAVSAGIVWYYRNSDSAGWPVRIALGLQLGGALGNLADRLAHGMVVTDFIWFSVFPAVFNVADAAISLGLVLLLLDVVLEYIHDRRAQAAQRPSILPEKA